MPSFVSLYVHTHAVLDQDYSSTAIRYERAGNTTKIIKIYTKNGYSSLADDMKEKS